MLKKLLKYEFKATARTYGGMYLALLAASVLFGGSVWRWNSTNSDAYSTLVGLLSLVYTAVIIGTVVVTIMTIVQRFYRNLLGREGYLMHTLPVTETQLVTSKLISSAVWSLCSILAACLSFGILAVLMMADMDLLEQLPRMWSIIQEAFARYNMEFWGALAFSVVRMVSAIACIYAACMVGHQFKNHPALAGMRAAEQAGGQGGGVVTSIDSSGPALERARAHVLLNGFNMAQAQFMDADVNASLRQFLKDGVRFDAIVLDPPKFAPTAAHADRAARAYKDINRLALQLLEPGGVLFTFSCSGGISADLFHKIVASAGADAGVDGYITERLGGAPDHPMTLEFPEGEYLKGLVVMRKA